MRRPEAPNHLSAQHANLLRRVRTLLRPVAAAPAPEPEPVPLEEPGIEALSTRVVRLEAMVEGLQDALYRQAQKEDERVEELRARIEPEALAKALSDDARRRGL